MAVTPLLLALIAQIGARHGMTGAGSGGDGNKTRGRTRGDDREARLADKLRENLRRRKALARSRGETAPVDPEPQAAPQAAADHDTKED